MIPAAVAPAPQFAASFFGSEKDNVPEAEELTFATLVDKLRAGGSPTKLGSPAWSPCVYVPPSRSKQNARAVFFAVFDFDNCPAEKFEPALGRIEASGLRAFVYTTHSDKPGLRKFRLVVALSRAVEPHEWEILWGEILRTLDLGIDADSACRDPGRIFYLPPPGAWMATTDGTNAVEVDALLKAHRPPLGIVSTPATPADEEEEIGDQTPIDMDAARDRLRHLKNPETRAIAQRVLKGECLAEPGNVGGGLGRDSTLQKITGAIVFALPESFHTDAIVELLRPSIAQMEPPEPGSRFPTWAEFAEDMIERARERKRAREAKEADYAAKVQADLLALPSFVSDSAPASTSSEARPAKPVAYHYAHDKYYVFQNGAWQFGEPRNTRSTAVFITERLLPEALKAPDADPKTLGDMDQLPNHPLVAKIDGFDCAPSQALIGTDGERFILNTWVTPTCEARQGDFQRIAKVLRHLTSNVDGKPDPLAEGWLTNWAAAKVQNAGSAMQTSPVIQGPPGSGKNTWLRAFMECLGRRNCAIIDQASLESQFNAGHANKLLVIADDCIPKSARLDLSGKLKTMITGETVQLHPKGVNPVEVKNRSAWIFTSNNSNPIEIEANDRRYSVFNNQTPITAEWVAFLRSFWIPQTANAPTEWFWSEIAAYRFHLEHSAVNYDLARTPYANDARNEIIAANLSSEAAFKLAAEEVGFSILASELAARIQSGAGGGYQQPDALILDRLIKKGATQRKVGDVQIAAGDFSAADVLKLYQVWSKENGRRAGNETSLGRCLTTVKPYWPRYKKGRQFYTVPAAPPSEVSP